MEPIAIIGIGCRFATATNAVEFFDLLKRGVDATTEIPADRWSGRSFYDPDRRMPGKLATQRGGFLPRIDAFDARFFGISPREAACMDPQQRLLLEVSWEAMEDGGMIPERLAGKDVGVYVGGFTLDYKRIQLGHLNRRLMDAHTATGAMMTMLSNRLSHAFDFRGPSMSIDTACSSSLVAVHLACSSLRNGECAIALAGGVNVIVVPEYTMAESKGGFLAPDGRSKPFSAAANGYGRAEGAGIVVLKKLSAARADGDPIYAVIRGSAVNQDGHTDGITVPSGDAQTKLIFDACRNAGVEAAEVQYVEAHGTGTPVGDPIEAQALSAALGTGRAKESRCIVGSVKGNIGHTEAAAGVAGLIKATMCIRNREIPPSLHFDQPNPAIPFDQLSFRIPTSIESWPAGGGRLLAGVNSFGFGGTNAHVILDQAPGPEEPEGPAEQPAGGAVVFPVSAKSPEAVGAAARQLRDYARSADEQGIAFRDMFYSAAFRRSHHDHRLGVVASSTEELANLLDAHLAGEPRAGVSLGAVRSANRPRVVFVCTGMGPQWWAMGRQLFESEPVFRQAILECEEIFQRVAGWSLVKEMMADEAESRMAETRLAQPANFAIQTAIAAMWKSWGIQPDAIVGHSVGEVSASYLSGALSLEDAIRVSFHRSRLQQTTAGRGAMLAVGLPAENALEWIEPYEGRLSPAAINSPTSVTISGDTDAIRDLAERLAAKQIFSRQLRVDIAYHSAQMNPLQEELLESLDGLAPRPAAIPLYSTVTGGRVDGTEINAAYWWRNVREPVRFAAAMDAVIEDGFELFLEVGPHPVLASSIHECLSTRRKEGVSLCSLRRDEDERRTMLNALASFYSAGFAIEWEAFRSGSARFVRLPSYPWQRERHWSESEESIADRIGVGPHPFLTRPINSAGPTWEVEINTHLLPYLRDHTVGGAVVFPGAGYVEMALAAGKEVFGGGDIVVEDIRFHRALFLPEGERPRTQITVDADEGTFEIDTRKESGGWTRNATGRLIQGYGSEPPALNAAEIQGRCETAFEKEDCYRQFAAQGFQYGPAFQRINRIHVGDAEVLAWFDDVDSDAEYQVHPAILDACLQALVATDPFRGADGSSSRSYLPVSIRKIRMWRRPHGRLWAWARLTRRHETGATGSIVCCDADGAVVIEIEDLEVRTLDTAAGLLTRERLEQNLYEMRWLAAARETAPAAVERQSCWALLADATGVADRLAKRLDESGATVIMVRPGAEYEFQKEAMMCRLNPEAPEHFARLLRDIGAATGRAPAGVAHLWNLDLQAEPSPGQLAEAVTLGALSMLHLVQAIVQAESATGIWAVTRGAQAVGDQGAVSVAQAPVWGLGRVVGHQEHIGIWGGLVDLDPAPSADEIDALFSEITQRSEEDQTAFRGGERYIARLQRCSDLTPALPVRLKPDASYLITGAFGALGLLTARWMVERGARRLILMGRSALPGREQWDDEQQRPDVARKIAAVRELESMGAMVEVAPVDVADETQLDEFLQHYERQGWPAIRGVVHSAGLVRDQLLTQMDAQSFRDVLRPKVHGAWNLHRALIDMPLDFFVLYSSVGSIVAAMGQANYASANSFLDALAHDRRLRGLPALSINWGPWAVGMVNDLHLAEHYAARGMDVIMPEHGMRYLGRLLGQRNAEVAVLSANWSTLAEFQLKVSPMIAHLAVESQTDWSEAGESGAEDLLTVLAKADPADQCGLIEQHLRSLTARVLRMDQGQVDASAPLSALGLDSMMAMELKNRLDLSLRVPVPMLDLLKGASISDLAPELLRRLIEDSEIRQVLQELEEPSDPMRLEVSNTSQR